MSEDKTNSSEMAAQLLDNLEFLRRIRGRFRDSLEDCILYYAIAGISGVLSAVFFFLLLHHVLSGLPFTADHWGGVWVVFIGFGMAAFFGMNADRGLCFTGLEIIAYRGGKLIWRIPIDSITAVAAERSGNVLWMHLHANGRKYSMIVVPQLSQECQRVLEQAGDSAD